MKCFSFCRPAQMARASLLVLSVGLSACTNSSSTTGVLPAGASSVLDLKDPAERKSRVVAMVAAEARQQGVPVPLGLAVAKTESGFDPLVRSPAGAIGVMQVMPQTARVLGYQGSVADLFKPEVNIPLGITYLRQGYVEGGAHWAALRYHGGPNRRMHGPKTRSYASAVIRLASTQDDGWIVKGTTRIAMGEMRSWSSFN